MIRHALIPLLLVASNIAIADVTTDLDCLPHQQKIAVEYARADGEPSQAMVCVPKEIGTDALRDELQTHLSAAAGAEVRLLRVELLLNDSTMIPEGAIPDPGVAGENR